MGDFSAQFYRPESGIHTIEGNVAGARAAHLTKKRQLEQDEFEQRKQQIAKDAERSAQSMDQKFAGDSSLSKAEKLFKENTVGLVTAQDFKKFSAFSEDATAAKKAEDEKQNVSAEELANLEKIARKARKILKKQKQKVLSTLSFGNEEDVVAILKEEENDGEQKKNPQVDTSFLPDKQRDDTQHAERRRLEKQWEEQQKSKREERLEIVYSYWDGSGHRRQVIIKKGDTIGAFLECVRSELSKEFREMQNVSCDTLVYVKEDLIIPQDLTFYDLIATRARGKSGPLFHFGVHDDIRVGAIDSRVEKDESHPGKVVERRWYNRNKHIFPASRWETFDPSKEYGQYTIHGAEVNKEE